MLRKQEFYEKEVWPRWMETIRRAPHRAILLPGIMGSELYDQKSDDTVWADKGVKWDIDNLEYDSFSPSGSLDINGQFIYARSTVHPPFVDDPYTRLFSALQPGGFNYDWRESLPIEAKRLGIFLEKLLLEDDRPVSFITHSMGGCLLLRLLRETDRFDEKIDQIICCAPPFHGALKPLRVIEDGEGVPGDWLINNSTLRRSAATLIGLFDLLVAPEDTWVPELPKPDGSKVILHFPVRTGENLYRLGSLTNRYRPDLRPELLQFAERYHRECWDSIRSIVERFGTRIHIIVGLHGKTYYAAKRHDGREWTLHTLPDPPAGHLSNGDGTVLFQSSFLPGLPTEHYWAYVPNTRRDTHGELIDEPDVIAAIDLLLRGQHLDQSKLINYNDFIGRIDWTHETANAPHPDNPGPTDHLNYLERARLRRLTPVADWGESLDPGDDDAITFYTTREAAIRVIHGADIKLEAERIGQDPDFLEQHLKKLLLPLLF